MLKESFFFLRSYKYEHFKRNFFCGTNFEGGVEDVAFPLGVLVFQVAWELEAVVQCQSSLLVPVGEAERAPKLPSLVERCSAEFAASRTIALAYSGLALHLGSSFDQNGCPKNRENCFEIMDSLLAVNDTKVTTKSEM